LKTVLVIDDDESLRLLLRDEFCDRGFNVVTACDGEEGLVSFNEADVDLVILDLNLPKINGKEVLEHLKAKSPDIPVVIYTANPSMLFDTENLSHVEVILKSTNVDDLMDCSERLAHVF
jgi:DNA-binding response OmpR family regulator